MHRFHIAPQVEHTIARLRSHGQFRSLAASLLGCNWDGACMSVRLRLRGAKPGDSEDIEADAAVVTTGPAHQGAIAPNPALASLAEAD